MVSSNSSSTAKAVPLLPQEKALSSLSQLANDTAGDADIVEVLEQNVTVIGVERIEAVAAKDLEKAAAVENEDAKLTELQHIGGLHQQNVAVAVAGLHSQAKVRLRSRAVLRVLIPVNTIL